jgi:hypothetical protein
LPKESSTNKIRLTPKVVVPKKNKQYTYKPKKTENINHDIADALEANKRSEIYEMFYRINERYKKTNAA